MADSKQLKAEKLFSRFAAALNDNNLMLSIGGKLHVTDRSNPSTVIEVTFNPFSSGLAWREPDDFP